MGKQGIPDNLEEDQILLLSHFRLALSAANALFQYAFVPQSFPWRCVLLLDHAHVTDTLSAMQRVWGSVRSLERSGHPVLADMRSTLALKIL